MYGWDRRDARKMKTDKEKIINFFANCLDSTYIKDEHFIKYMFDNHPNSLGLCNMTGNVAELVQEIGIAKGGSFTHSLEESEIKKRQIYTSPKYWLGFRCITELKITIIKKE